MAHYGLIGSALGHSRSPELFQAIFRREGITSGRYGLYELQDITHLPALLGNAPQLAGLNVTIPFKQAIIPMLHSLAPEATAVGAVNTVRIRDGHLSGYNTDIDGFRAMLAPHLELLRSQAGTIRTRALVLGSGGASRAVAYVLREQGVLFRVVSRSRERGDLTWDLLDRTIMGVCKLVINTTPLGMWPKVDEAPPLPYHAIGREHHLLDLVYNPEETLFMQRGRMAGAVVENGSVMLREQAEAAWRIWRT